ncbi:MAG: copper transporter [Clostridiales bacterium]|jgi:hypothetical protein|nr:copper transporter [Clostridiales bacterium]
MFRVKDHIISLVAVFLALGLGILIGTGISENMLVKQQRLLIDQMSRDFRVQRQEKVMLEAQLQAASRDLYLWEKFRSALYPGLVTGTLAGKNIAVVSHGAEIPPGVLAILHDAEAEITNVVKVADQSRLIEPVNGLGKALAMMISGNSIDHQQQEILDRFAATEMLEIQFSASEKPEAIILILGEQANTSNELVQQICENLDPEQLILIGLEWSEVTDSVLNDLKTLGFSTIDNADTAFGQFSLLSVLRGTPGNYGIKSTADQFVSTF